MLHELSKFEFSSLLPLLESLPSDPMLYGVIEKVRPGRVFVDRIPDPCAALIWTNMEYAYLICDSPAIGAEIVGVTEQTILPYLEEAGLDFITIFPFGVPPAAVLGWFEAHHPVSFGVNAYSFERERFEILSAQARPLPTGFSMLRLDAQALSLKTCQGIREDILFCWESLERFESLGAGYAIQDQQGELASACYAIGFGAGAYHINIWTRQEHRRKGLARHAALALLHECTAAGRVVYWINDAPNTASRRLAESLGFVYQADLPTVDIPVYPYRFHLGLAGHFSGYLGLHQQAGALYDIAFSIQDGDPEDYRKAAAAWRQAGDLEKANLYDQKAAG